ncbi:polyprenol dehydrogenase-like [Babylonia areolata]|uniref:polyprenol dehydrogenase-like n=1 Tax=Babylonia areolata TaxID=304850 RepID=UPI003FD3CAD5
MAVEEQTNLKLSVDSLFGTIVNVFYYIVYTIKLYAIGILALLMQLLRKAVPVRGLPSQAGRTAIVTGGASGIGLHVSKQLASLGASVIIACRRKEEAEIAIDIIQQECPSAKVRFMELDLASFSSVRRFVSDFLATGSPLHILINNGGVMLTPHHLTHDGQELHLQVNHLSHALLTSLLIPTMESSGDGPRVVNVSSVVHHVATLRTNTWPEEMQRDDWSYSPHNAYATSKLAILLYTYALSRRLAQKGSMVTVNAVHPGVVNTDLYQHVHWTVSWAMDILRHYFFMSPENAALWLLHVATSAELQGVSGCYFSVGEQCASSPSSLRPSLQETVFLRTQQLIGQTVDKGRTE